MKEFTFQQRMVLSAIARGAQTIQDIASTCGGLYPLELRHVIDTLAFANKITLSPEGYCFASPDAMYDGKKRLQEPNGCKDDLPEPHLHDYDWRFDTSTAHQLADAAIRECFTGGAILLLGAPSVFVELLYTQHAPYTILLDRNKTLVNYLSSFHLPGSFDVVEHDLLSGQLWYDNLQVDAVVCDPPWYLEHYMAFLAQAASVTQVGARIFVCLLPPNTRPDAPKERWEIFTVAHQLGLDLLSVESNIIRYKTPLFEQASLHSTFLDVNKNWRVSDLAIFGKVCHPDKKIIAEILASALSMNVEKQEWSEVLINRYKVKLRGPFNDYSEKPELLSIEASDTLPTVSRRYKGRESVDLWLWDNRVFAVKGKAAFLAALHILAGESISDHLQLVCERYLEQALALLTFKVGIIDFQTNNAWKVLGFDREHRFVSGGSKTGIKAP